MLKAALDSGVTEIDTAFNYAGFKAHSLLAEIDSSVTRRLAITTKVGFFADRHGLAPEKLAAAAHQTAEGLGRVPEVLLLHNPERSAPHLAAACEAMVQLRESGLCGSWGISTWAPAALLDYVDAATPQPEVLMVRCGLTVSHRVLTAAEALIDRLRPREVRGMAPFGGNPSDPLWQTVDPALFLTPASRSVNPERLQAALGVAFATPRVSAVAVGTSRASHLAQLCEASALNADPETIARYRTLLAERHKLSARTDSNAGKRLPS